MIEIENLTKTFGTQTVISDVSGIFYPGKIYGFVGRNGSGKTVLMKMILGFIKPTSGTIKVNGKQVGKEIDIPDDIGAIIETPGFLPEYSAFQNLKLMAMIRGKITSKRMRQWLFFLQSYPFSFYNLVFIITQPSNINATKIQYKSITFVQYWIIYSTYLIKFSANSIPHFLFTCAIYRLDTFIPSLYSATYFFISS